MKYNENIIITLISLGLTGLFATLSAFAGSAIIGSFWGWFWITVLLMVIIFALVNTYFLRKDAELQQLVETRLVNEIIKTSIAINCSYCHISNVVPVQIGEKNTFMCESCNQVNKITIQFVSTALTTPLETVKIPLESETVAEFKVRN
jgi:hypothetical protein